VDNEPALLKSRERSISSSIRDPGVDGCVFDATVSEVFFHKLKRLAGVEKMRRNGVAQAMAGCAGWEPSCLAVLCEEFLDSTFAKRSLTASEEWRFERSGRVEVSLKKFTGAFEERPNSPNATFRPSDDDPTLHEIDVAVA
jgi:hypothetical protein